MTQSKKSTHKKVIKQKPRHPRPARGIRWSEKKEEKPARKRKREIEKELEKEALHEGD